MDDLHPIRIWRLDKNFSKKLQAYRDLMAKARRKFGGPRSGLQFFERPILLNEELVTDMDSLQMNLFKERQVDHWIQSFLKFWDEYRQVFAFDDSLSEALSATDIGDVPWSELRLPHQEFYLSLSDYGQQSFLIRDFEYIIDGAYVRRVPKESLLFPHDSLLFQFTSRLIYPSYQEAQVERTGHGYRFGEPIYEYCISGEGCATIGEAINRGEAEFLRHCDSHDRNLFESAKDLAPEFDVVPFGRPLHLNREKFERGRSIIRDSIPILFNAIFYLAACPERRSEGFPKSAPPDLVQAYRHTNTPSLKKTAENALARKGFSKIVFVRDPDIEGRSSSVGKDRAVRGHWRRGHWRNQPHGPGMELRRWVWIKPVLVKASESLKLGGLHDVKPEK